MLKMSISKASKAPGFRRKDIFGNVIDSKHYRDQHLLLVFLRYSGCPFCNLAVHRLALEHKLLKKSGCEVIAFMQSSPKNIIENIYDRHAVRPSFPIIADPDKRLYNRYGVRSSVGSLMYSIVKIPYWVHAVKSHGFKQKKIDGDLFLVPAMFLIGPDDQPILQTHTGNSLYDHTTMGKIYETLQFEPAG